jgi:hypothetical protein
LPHGLLLAVCAGARSMLLLWLLLLVVMLLLLATCMAGRALGC